MQQSPEALQAASSAIQGALGLAEETTQSSLGYAAQQSANAGTLAQNSTGSGPTNSILKTVGLIVVAVVVVFFFIFRKAR
jgi:hypothetical protein